MDHRGDKGVGDYVSVLRRRKWIVLLAMTAAPAAAVALSLQQPKLFSASADILLTSAATGAQSPVTGAGTSDIATQLQVAGAPVVAERVLRSTGLTSRTAGQIRGEASFGPVGAANVLRVSITDRSPSIAVTLANAYAHQYTAYRHQLDTAFLGSTRKQIEARMAALKAAGDKGTALYKTLAQKDQQLLQLEALQTVDAVVLRPADGASQIQPTPKRYGILGLIVGVMLAFALALLWDAIDPRVRTAHAVAELIGLPVLARLTAPRRRLRKQRRLVMLEDTSGRDADALRILGTNLEFANVDQRYKLVMFTSPMGSEGKSTTVANLAVALARAGKKVVLVDLDLHRPVIEKFFDLEGRPGLTSVALGRATLEDAIAKVPIAELPAAEAAKNGVGAVTYQNGNGHGSRGVTLLEVLPAGPLPPHPGEFVASQAVRSILDSLRDRADIVLIDTPPLLEMSDTLALSGVVDGIILVARVKAARRPLLRQTRQVLDSAPAAKLGVVLTGAERETGYWYERYGSYYPRTAPTWTETVQHAEQSETTAR
jgi:non-specific protein-tyrosine kinase